MRIVVIRLSPRPRVLNYLLNDRAQFFQAVSQDYFAQQLTVFHHPVSARRYMNRYEDESFLTLSFASLLAAAFENMHNFFNHLNQVSYHSPRVAERVFQPRRQARQLFHHEDHAFLDAQLASLQVNHAPSTPNFAVKAAANIEAGTFPLGAKVVSEVKENGAFCSISQDYVKENLVAVKTGRGVYQVYDRDALFQHFKANTKDGKTFTDPNTRAVLDITKDVFQVSWTNVSKQNQPTQNPSLFAASRSNRPKPPGGRTLLADDDTVMSAGRRLRVSR